MCDETPEVSGMITLSSRMDVRKACDDVVKVVKLLNYDERDLFAVRLAVEETLTNAIIHGNKEDPDKKARVDYVIYRDKVNITVSDEGEGFDCKQVDDCTQPNHLMRAGGRGVRLIQEFMDEVRYSDKGNSVQMVRFRGRNEGNEDSR